MADTEAPTPTLAGAGVAVGLKSVVGMVGLGLIGKAVDDTVCLRGVVIVDIEGLGFGGMVRMDDAGLWLALGGMVVVEEDGLGFGETNMVDIVGLGFKGKDMVDVDVLGCRFVVMVGAVGLGFSGKHMSDVVRVGLEFNGMDMVEIIRLVF